MTGKKTTKTAETRRGAVKITIASAVLLVCGLTAGALVGRSLAERSNSWEMPAPAAPKVRLTLGDLLTMQTNDVAGLDIAEINLLCAQGLPGSEDLDVAKCLAVLDEWAAGIAKATEEKKHVFRDNPEHWNNSENWWRCALIKGYLTKVAGTSYNPALREKAIREQASGDIDGFDTSSFGNARYIFTHGLLTGDRQGTCSSFPVLMTALGRRLGYPLKLVRGQNHLFARWDDGKERFNIEATDKYAESKPDEFYRRWPFPNYLPLRSLTPEEELSVFLSFRALCLWENKRLREAESAFAHAHVMEPQTMALIPCLERLLLQERQEYVQALADREALSEWTLQNAAWLARPVGLPPVPMPGQPRRAGMEISMPDPQSLDPVTAALQSRRYRK